MARVPSQLTPLKLTQRAGRELTRVCPPAALADPSWIGSPVEPAPPGVRRFLTDLSLPVRERSPRVLFKKAAFVDVGPARSTSDGCQVQVSWQSSSLAPLFPVFSGWLRVSGREITLDGLYAPPGGPLGVVLDRAFLNIAARGTARWFLEQVQAALLAESAVDGMDPSSPEPARASSVGADGARPRSHRLPVQDRSLP